MTSFHELSILVTGFGVGMVPSQSFCVSLKFSKDWHTHKNNPSGKIASQLPTSITHQNHVIEIKTALDPIKVSYHDIHTQIPPLINETKPQIILHIGLDDSPDAKNTFHIERGANRDGYNSLTDAEGKVFTKAETKEAFGKSATYISTSFNLDEVLKKWQAQLDNPQEVRSKKSKQPTRGKPGLVSLEKSQLPRLAVTDDVGNFVCGFIYYQTLHRFNGTKPGVERPVLFLHVPELATEESLDTGRRVTIALIKAAAESYWS